jgi:hypothetical protein
MISYGSPFFCDIQNLGIMNINGIMEGIVEGITKSLECLPAGSPTMEK